MSDETNGTGPKKRAGIVLLPGVELSPQSCLGQILEDIDDVESVVAIVRWKNNSVSVRQSPQNIEQGALCLLMYQRFLATWIDSMAGE